MCQVCEEVLEELVPAIELFEEAISDAMERHGMVMPMEAPPQVAVVLSHLYAVCGMVDNRQWHELRHITHNILNAAGVPGYELPESSVQFSEN